MFKQGEVYTCPDSSCGCEITVTKDARRSTSGHAHRCCCGMEMRLKA